MLSSRQLSAVKNEIHIERMLLDCYEKEEIRIGSYRQSFTEYMAEGGIYIMHKLFSRCDIFGPNIIM